MSIRERVFFITTGYKVQFIVRDGCQFITIIIIIPTATTTNATSS